MEKGHYDVSVAVSEHDLCPAVRAADADAVVLADGFSCRTQLADLAGVPALTSPNSSPPASDRPHGRATFRLRALGGTQRVEVARFRGPGTATEARRSRFDRPKPAR